jgi:signal transduction histidine kinase
VQHRVRRHDGSWLWIESVARANRRAADGRALRITGANTDITERKAVEALKSEFIATVSHELRTPLTSLLASLALVREGAAGELAPQAKSFVDIAYANSERLADLVNDILDMEKIESGGMELRLQQVALGPFLARVVELNAPYAEKYGVRLVAGGGDGLEVQADPERLMQVLTNLASNAIKFSPPGEEVRITASALPHAARLEVTDRGPGIPPEFRSRIFGKFAQAEERAERQQGGTGLGLAITKALVERMSGRIGFDTETGRGTTFWAELPRVS